MTSFALKDLHNGFNSTVSRSAQNSTPQFTPFISPPLLKGQILHHSSYAEIRDPPVALPAAQERNGPFCTVQLDLHVVQELLIIVV